MTAKLLISIRGVTGIGGAVGLVAECFHLPQTFLSTGVGIVIGLGRALGCILTLAQRNQVQLSNPPLSMADCSQLIAHC